MRTPESKDTVLIYIGRSRGSRPGTRRSYDEIVHYDRYDMSKYEGIIDFLRELRGLTRRGYHDEPKKEPVR